LVLWACMRHIVYIGSHLGYPMERTPLGGGAMVGLQLVRHWARRLAQENGGAEFCLTVVGAGGVAPDKGIRYVQLPQGAPPDLVRASEMGYARFCRIFEAETTAFIEKSEFKPEDTTILVNDISESPNLDRLAALGFPIVSIWHVDVVEFFNRIYLGGFLAPERLTGAFAWLEDRGWAHRVPDVLRLVFQKQRQAVRRSRVLILPSRQMSETIRRCYPGCGPRMMVLPWGGWRETYDESEAAQESERLKKHYQIKPNSLILMTLSRISPEKGIHLLLEALSLLEKAGDLGGRDVCLFICGETAFMRGEAYGKKVRKAAERLKNVRVFFPGYLPALEKQAYFLLADLFISPSVHESYGLTLVEAMRGGLPVLASDHYGVEEILDDSYGRAVSYDPPANRAANLAAGLKDLLADRRRLAKMGDKAKEASEEMTFEASSRRLWEAVASADPGRGGEKI